MKNFLIRILALILVPIFFYSLNKIAEINGALITPEWQRQLDISLGDVAHPVIKNWFLFISTCVLYLINALVLTLWIIAIPFPSIVGDVIGGWNKILGLNEKNN